MPPGSMMRCVPIAVMNGIGARRLHAPSSSLSSGVPAAMRIRNPDGQSFRNSLGVRWDGSASSTFMSSSGGRSPSHQVGMEG